MHHSVFAFCLLVAGALIFTDAATAQSRPEYDYVYIGDPLPDAVMQQNKETFVLYGCAYCHGINLKPVGEAPDLRLSPLVGADVDANLIGPLLRAGIPQTPKSSPMPQFSDLSDREIRAIAAYIHYERARVRYQQLMAAPASVGDATTGKSHVEQNCASCHRDPRNLAAPADDAATLRARILQPAAFQNSLSFKLERRNDAVFNAGRLKHQALVENISEAEVANIVAYVQSLK